MEIYMYPPPSQWYPPLGKNDFSFLPCIFFLVYIDSPRRFLPWYFSLYISCFNQTNPHHSHYLFILCQHSPLIFNAYRTVHYIIFIYRWLFL
jgi:hypothetical protein